MRPPSGDEEVLAPKKVKEKKRKGAPSSPISEKKNPARKDEPEEGEEEVAHVRANVVIQKSSELAKVGEGTLAIIPEPKKVEATPSRAEMVEGEAGGEASCAAEDISRDELEMVDISGSPQILDAMICEANMLES
nr:uncharacterized protein LOC104110583 [Nicotiana tomentosiformis]